MTMNMACFVTSGVALFAAIVIAHIQDLLKFNRTNPYGVQVFESYWRVIVANIGNCVAYILVRSLLCIATFCAMGGVAGLILGIGV